MDDRKADLKLLNKKRKDYSLPEELRLSAERAYHKVKKQMKNPRLMKTRQRLIKAVQAGDYVEANKIEKEIRRRFGRI